ncbi:MAG TPA: 2-phospho-L-lactate guanylyltransferase [Acidimicrobiales bacterium]|nr:2-phospho-L-lactate guanylyltransferase [Acidimicrobiales bacterium]
MGDDPLRTPVTARIADLAGRAGAIGADAVLVPVKAFGQAKLRLAPALSPDRRAALARTMATRVVESAAGLAVAVVCDNLEVATWARKLGARVIWEPGRGLNGAVQQGVDRLAADGARLVVVAAGDLPLASDLRWVTEFDGITIVPDRHRDGTNVICVPGTCGFRFSYGPGSFARHVAEAERVKVGLRVVQDTPLAWDVDVPDDLAAVQD